MQDSLSEGIRGGRAQRTANTVIDAFHWKYAVACQCASDDKAAHCSGVELKPCNACHAHDAGPLCPVMEVLGICFLGSAAYSAKAYASLLASAILQAHSMAMMPINLHSPTRLISPLIDIQMSYLAPRMDGAEQSSVHLVSMQRMGPGNDVL